MKNDSGKQILEYHLISTPLLFVILNSGIHVPKCKNDVSRSSNTGTTAEEMRKENEKRRERKKNTVKNP